MATALANEPNPAAESPVAAPDLTLEQRSTHEGLLAGAHDLSVGAAAGRGIDMFGSRQAHDLAWGSIGYGRLIWQPLAQGHWYRGQFEFRGEFFGGGQFSPSCEWLVGLTPHLRYNFMTGRRWVPFIDAGAGFTITSINRPDLSTTFEFNLQVGPGLHYFLKDNLALTVEARYLHMSNAGIHHPNLGVNTIMGQFGVTWFF